MWIEAGVIDEGLLGDFWVWTYADYATAAASGDSWSNGDFILTNDGLILRKFDTITDGAGLMPAFPLGINAGLLTAATRVEGYAGGTDPRTSESWNNSNTGTEGVDYSITPAGGLTTYTQITGTGSVVLSSPTTVDSSYTSMVGLFESASASYTSSVNEHGSLSVRRYVSGTTVGFGQLKLISATSSTNWSIMTSSSTSADTGIALATSQTIWCGIGPSGNNLVVSSIDVTGGYVPSAADVRPSTPGSTPVMFIRAGLPPQDRDVTIATGDVGIYLVTLSV